MKPISGEASSIGQLVGSQSYKIITQYGDMLVIKQGIQHQPHSASRQSPNHHHSHHQHHQQHLSASATAHEQQQPHQARPVIMTFHDIGLNSELQFARFCDCDEVKLMLQTFTMIHVNFIGQEFDNTTSSSNNTTNGTSADENNDGAATPAPNLSDDFRYPNVDQMAESIVDICTQLKVRSFIALAVGAGAYIVSSLALMRPDLIDGLFLINPVVSSCSITEWLYFKMSAIASNHHIGGSSSGDNQHGSPSSSASSPKSGLRKLISAATNLHLSHNHHQHHHHQRGQSNNSPHSNSDQPDQEQDTQSIGQDSIRSSHSNQSKSSQQQQQQQSSSSGSRLRQLIFSRNLRTLSSNSSSTSSFQQSLAADKQLHEAATTPGAATTADADEGIATGQPACRSACKRAPSEYLMYHHFGPASFQRYRRSSDTSNNLSGSQADLESAGPEAAGQRQEAGSTSSRHSSPASASGGSLGRTDSARQLARPPGSGRLRAARRRRSGSVCMTASHLASFASDRQRQAYIQGAYKHYFYQINAHNLWLFAQSFVKRRTLNLRKDCGAAAHAAAAAATLGTSIYSAFVGVAPSGPALGDMGASSRLARPDEHPTGSSVSACDPVGSPQSGPNQQRMMLQSGATNSPKQQPKHHQKQQQQQQARALVAGTKVKRTFTCQTLIMCSSVPMHCERAFKLMSLLNPLQATWIKTDHLLVLEERPDKVCQALRLFLQGIGYSMSTYERRLRLSSTTGSAGSADSCGSARSYPGDDVSA